MKSAKIPFVVIRFQVCIFDILNTAITIFKIYVILL